jgi:hypothetical protein
MKRLVQSAQRGSSPTVREGLGSADAEPSLTIGLLPRITDSIIDCIIV